MLAGFNAEWFLQVLLMLFRNIYPSEFFPFTTQCMNTSYISLFLIINSFANICKAQNRKLYAQLQT